MEQSSTKRDILPLPNALFVAIPIKDDIVLQVSTQRQGDVSQAFRQVPFTEASLHTS